VAEQIEAKKQHSVVKSAIYFASGTLVSRILGLARESILVAVFGKTICDAWFAAFRFPNLFRRIFGEGALSACFIPLYVEYKEKGDIKSLSQLTVGVLSLLLIILIPLNVVVIATIDQFVPLWVGGRGFSEVPGKLELTVQMTKIMFPFLLLVCLFAFFMAVLNAHKKFVMSAVAPSLFNLTLILFSLYCYYTDQISGIILAWSVIAAGFVQFIVLVPPFLRLGIPYDFSFKYITSEPVRRTLKAFLPSILGLGIVQIMALINVNFASRLAEGSVTHISLADRILELPLSLVAVSLGTVLLPTLSEKLGASFVELNNELNKNLKVLLFLSVPSAIGMWMTAEILVRVLFERGAFTHDQSVIVAGIVQVYAFTLLWASLARVMSQAFYAHKNTTTPALASLAGLILHLVLAPQLMIIYGIYGLVGSTAAASFVNCTFLFAMYRVKYGRYSFPSLLVFFGRCALAGLAIVGVCYTAQYFLPQNNFYERLLALAVAVGFSIVGYFSLSLVFRIDEAHVVLRKLKRRF